MESNFWKHFATLSRPCRLQPARSLSRWCKSTHAGVSLRDFAVCGAKPSHHSPQMLVSQFHGVCLCTTGEDEVEKGERGRAAVSLDVMQKHARRCLNEILR